MGNPRGINPELLGELARVGYEDASVDDIIRLNNHGVSPRYLSEVRRRDCSNG